MLCCTVCCSHNHLHGILAEAKGLRVFSAMVGTTADGEHAAPNFGHGIALQAGADDCTIGGANSSFRRPTHTVISGNGGMGVQCNATRMRVEHATVGLSALGQFIITSFQTTLQQIVVELL